MLNKKHFSLAKKLRKDQTIFERRLWFYLKGNKFEGLKFRRQQPVGNYIVDFINFEKKLIIEIDGGQHNEELNIKNDIGRTEWLKNEGFTVIRFWNNDIMNNIEGILEKIKEVINELDYYPPSPQPSPLQGEGVIT